MNENNIRRKLWPLRDLYYSLISPLQNEYYSPTYIVVASITASIFDEFYFPDFHKSSKMDYMAGSN